MHIVYGVGSYATLANIFFLLSGIASDLFLLRLWLCFSYIFLLVNGIQGYPGWGVWTQATPTIFELGGIIWPAVVLIVHLYHLSVLVWDERPIRFASDDEEQLWRLFYRRSGMGRLEMQRAFKHGSWRRYKAGEEFCDTENDKGGALSLHLLVEGVCTFSAYPGKQSLQSKESYDHQLYSGFLFDFKVANTFGVYLGQEYIKLRKVTAKTDCLLYVWDFNAVQRMAGDECPALAAGWRNFVLYSLGSAFSDTHSQLYSSNGELEEARVFEGARSRDMTEPLSRDEKRQLSHFDGIFWWILKQHYPIPPSGQRHHGVPPSGMLAQGRIKAQQDHAALAIQIGNVKPGHRLGRISMPRFGKSAVKPADPDADDLPKSPDHGP